MILYSTTPSNFVILFKGDFMLMYLGLEVILHFGFTKFGGNSLIGAQIHHDWLIFGFPHFGGMSFIEY